MNNLGRDAISVICWSLFWVIVIAGVIALVIEWRLWYPAIP